MRPHYVFIDSVAPYTYVADDLQRRAMGGTQATVLRIAKALTTYADVTIAQSARTQRWIDDHGIQYVPYDHKHCDHYQADAFVVIRAHKLLPKLRRLYPDKSLFLWMHCFPGMRLRELARVCVDSATTVLAVSDFHQQWMQDFYARYDAIAAKSLKIKTMYNPVDEQLQQNTSPWNRNKLLFMSSPHKGLDQVLHQFSLLRKRIPELTLHIANPGYLNWKVVGEDTGVKTLGALSHGEVIQHLRSSLCLFYPQNQFAETFGIVFAEAMAVGTPTLTHPIGAAPEVLGSNEQLCDAQDSETIYQRIRHWRDGQRYQPVLPDQFRIENLLQQWRDLLDDTTTVTAKPVFIPTRLASSAEAFAIAK